MNLLPMNRLYDELANVRIFTAKQPPPYIKFIHVFPEPGMAKVIKKLGCGQ